ncbi:MAG TPA: hypothetical protein VMC10_25395 [Stellaceae bacterium]|nr:hypothetical protein [Stellaceae bacterium]
MKPLLIAALSAVLTTAALGAETLPSPPPGGVAVSKDGTVVVSKAACAQVVEHVPDAGVAYQPGVDVNGNKVAPADLPASPSAMSFDSFPIQLDLNLRKKFQIPPQAQLFNFKAEFGTLQIQGNQVLFNGKPIAAGEANLLAAACRAHGF